LVQFFVTLLYKPFQSGWWSLLSSINTRWWWLVVLCCAVLWIIASSQQQWSFCPFIGGFDFRTYANNNKEVKHGRFFLRNIRVLVTSCKINDLLLLSLGGASDVWQQCRLSITHS